MSVTDGVSSLSDFPHGLLPGQSQRSLGWGCGRLRNLLSFLPGLLTRFRFTLSGKSLIPSLQTSRLHYLPMAVWPPLLLSWILPHSFFLPLSVPRTQGKQNGGHVWIWHVDLFVWPELWGSLYSLCLILISGQYWNTEQFCVRIQIYNFS